jgi:hypothetical protein
LVVRCLFGLITERNSHTLDSSKATILVANPFGRSRLVKFWAKLVGWSVVLFWEQLGECLRTWGTQGGIIGNILGTPKLRFFFKKKPLLETLCPPFLAWTNTPFILRLWVWGRMGRLVLLVLWWMDGWMNNYLIKFFRWMDG